MEYKLGSEREGREIHTKPQQEILKRRDHLGDAGISKLCECGFM
jgi:hypothetical protein